MPGGHVKTFEFGHRVVLADAHGVRARDQSNVARAGTTRSYDSHGTFNDSSAVESPVRRTSVTAAFRSLGKTRR